MDEPLSRPAHTENSAIAGSRLEQIAQIAMQQASAVGQLYRRVVQRHQPAVEISPIACLMF
jgi:hypothetical protein